MRWAAGPGGGLHDRRALAADAARRAAVPRSRPSATIPVRCWPCTARSSRSAAPSPRSASATSSSWLPGRTVCSPTAGRIRAAALTVVLALGRRSVDGPSSSGPPVRRRILGCATPAGPARTRVASAGRAASSSELRLTWRASERRDPPLPADGGRPRGPARAPGRAALREARRGLVVDPEGRARRRRRAAPRRRPARVRRRDRARGPGRPDHRARLDRPEGRQGRPRLGGRGRPRPGRRRTRTPSRWSGRRAPAGGRARPGDRPRRLVRPGRGTRSGSRRHRSRCSSGSRRLSGRTFRADTPNPVGAAGGSALDTWKFYDITHRDHVVCNPTSVGEARRGRRPLDPPHGPSRPRHRMRQG